MTQRKTASDLFGDARALLRERKRSCSRQCICRAATILRFSARWRARAGGREEIPARLPPSHWHLLPELAQELHFRPLTFVLLGAGGAGNWFFQFGDRSLGLMKLSQKYELT